MDLITCRPARQEDLPILARIEQAATPGLNYLLDCAQEFLDPTLGELVVAVDAQGLPHGFAHFSIQPDGSGWLECLRVEPEHQKQGYGSAIWARFLQLCQERRVPHVGMYTGPNNYASRTLGERNGLRIVYENREGRLPLEEVPPAPAPAAFRLLTDPAQVAQALAPLSKEYEDHFCMNRTYAHFSPALYAYLAREQQVWSDGESVIVLGTRFLKDRALHIGAMGGDLSACLALARSQLLERKLPQLTAVIPAGDDVRRSALEGAGFHFPASTIIMLERDF